jgi:hypothetical protein
MKLKNLFKNFFNKEQNAEPSASAEPPANAEPPASTEPPANAEPPAISPEKHFWIKDESDLSILVESDETINLHELVKRLEAQTGKMVFGYCFLKNIEKKESGLQQR